MAGEGHQGLSFCSPACLASTNHRLNKGVPGSIAGHLRSPADKPGGQAGAELEIEAS